MVELKRTPPPARRPPAATVFILHSPLHLSLRLALLYTPSSHPGFDSFSTAKHLLHPNCASSTSSSIFLAKGPPTQLDDYDFGCEEDISHRRSRRVKAADFFSQAPDRPDSPPSALRAFQPPSPANHTDIITSSHSSPQLQPNPTPTIPHPGLVFEQSATRIRTSHS